ncbi:MAG: hypothetical protein M3394_05290, partial [Actinomycetota bacterium]|nr:hypothetical protein [Actinomycetota bacterium]
GMFDPVELVVTDGAARFIRLADSSGGIEGITELSVYPPRLDHAVPGESGLLPSPRPTDRPQGVSILALLAVIVLLLVGGLAWHVRPRRGWVAR